MKMYKIIAKLKFFKKISVGGREWQSSEGIPSGRTRKRDGNHLQ